MRPNIDFHGIERTELGKILEFEATPTCRAFASRCLTLVGEDGERFEIKLFGVDADSIRLPHELTAQDRAQAEEASNRG